MIVDRFSPIAKRIAAHRLRDYQAITWPRDRRAFWAQHRATLAPVRSVVVLAAIEAGARVHGIVAASFKDELRRLEG